MVSEIKVKAEKLRDRLLDLSGRNNFIKYNHASDKKKQKFLRFVNEVPELLIQNVLVEESIKAASVLCY